MVFIELAFSIVGLWIIRKITVFSKIPLLLCWLFSICLPLLFVVVTNHSVLRSPKNWITVSAYFVYLTILVPILLVISVMIVLKQERLTERIMLYLLCGAVLTASFYLMLPVGILQLDHFYPLLAWPILAFIIYMVAAFTLAFSHSSEKV